MKGVIKLTYLDKLKEIDPDFIATRSVGDLERCILGCPHSHGLEENLSCPESSELDYTKYDSCCIACWHREYPEEKEAEPELTYEINLKEEKKMKNLRSLIESKVEDAIAAGKIDDYIENIVEDMDLDGDIDDLIETEIRENIADYVGPILSEAVRDAVRNALDDLFN